jgi:2-oxoisovalerate dehydrogenase E1 component
VEPAEVVHQNFLKRVAASDFPTRTRMLAPRDVGLTDAKAVEIFQSQILSRQLDRISRKLQARGEGFYTIGSSGHEGNAAIAEAFRIDDMAFLHYRDAAFQIQRSKKRDGETPAWDMLLSFAASAEDPISGGRHKVLGSKSLFIPPQTSTIASHLPKAMGAAYSIGLAKRLHLDGTELPSDGVILCSFGDASANHSTAQGALNSAAWTSYQGAPMPIVFVCEDNGIGISTRTPRGWIEANFSSRPGLHYIKCDGLDILDTYRAACEAEAIARQQRRAVFLHMRCVRLYGHAGSDVQAAYMTKAEVQTIDNNDPLIHAAGMLVSSGILTSEAVIEMYDGVEATLMRVAEEAIKRPKITTAKQVMASLIPSKRAVARGNGPSVEARTEAFGTEMGAMDKPQHLAKLLNWALTDAMLEHPDIVLAGEDIGPKGGVYGVTTKLHARFGASRVINTLLDEQSILGLGIGLAHNGFLPIPEIQFLAYVHNAEDQIRGEAATLSFFSQGQYANPMIVRIAGLGYQKGFGGHFHNDNSLAALRDIPGLVIACPSNGHDAVHMLRECVRLGREEQRVIVFIEPIALYMTRDLHADKDGQWTFLYDPPGHGAGIRLGELGVHGDGTDLAILTYGNGYYLSRQAERIIKENGRDIRVIDLRWLAPLNADAIIAAVSPCRGVLIVDECRATGSQSEALVTLMTERAPHLPVRRVVAQDSFIPLARAATLTLPSRDEIVAAALEMTVPKRERKQA